MKTLKKFAYILEHVCVSPFENHWVRVLNFMSDLHTLMLGCLPQDAVQGRLLASNPNAWSWHETSQHNLTFIGM